MWRFKATLRERKHLTEVFFNNHSTTSVAAKPNLNKSNRYYHDIALQLDYYMSPQFAGVASALLNDSYTDKGLKVRFLPTCPVGLEQQRVRMHQNDNPTQVSIGSVEQNIFIPTLYSEPHLKTTAVAAMFQRSPLCIASMPGVSHQGDDKLTIGVHEDTVDLMRRVFPQHDIVASPRATKNTDLLSGTFDAIQAYTTTEVPTLRYLGSDGLGPEVSKLEGLNGTKLGYSQVLFTADECLEGEQRAVVVAFCEATFEGWKYVIRYPEESMEQVREAKKMLGLDDESNDHWHPSDEFELEMLMKCNDFVKGTFEGDRYGVINASRWNEANQWLLQGEDTVGANFGLDPNVWQTPKNLLSGNNLARKVLEDAKKSAFSFRETYGRNPSLAVITVGDLERYKHGNRRLQIYSDKSSSWFSKSSTGEANGFDVKEINLDASTSTDELLSQIYALDKVDGIQLMWPLPDHIDSTKVYSAIIPSKDVDGIHYIGQREIGNKNAYPPVTPSATIALLEEFDVSVENKRVLVIGRSPIVGSPVAHMLREREGAVTVVHSKISKDRLRTLVEEAEIIVSCAGSPGLIEADWIKNGAVVINVGTTFDEELDSLVSDVNGDIGAFASRFSPVPGGIGPISAPKLFENVAQAAWDRMTSGTDSVLDSGWDRFPSKLRKMFHFDSYTAALDAAKKVDEMSTIMDHHANMKFSHKCVKGVDLEMEFFTYEAKALTEKDYDAAKSVDMVLSKDKIEMSKYSYNLKENSIALYPASPRGSSKLLKIAGSGELEQYSNFSESFASLAKGCHIVFNNSRVLDARLFVTKNGAAENVVELMLLDLGAIDVRNKCTDTPLQAMIRSDDVQAGDVLKDAASGTNTIEVVEVKGIWHEDEGSNGNGTECIVRVHSGDSVEEYLSRYGSVPIPPYLHRDAEASDKTAYNNTYAASAGSVAAPTAGLHFTKDVLEKIGSINCSYLTLHVGAGTFKPVLVEDVRDHEMHAETFCVPVSEVKNIIAALKQGKPLISVGTTSSRTLESLFWCGVKRLRGLDDNNDSGTLTLGQMEWVPLRVGEGRNVSRIAALEALVKDKDDFDVLRGKTSLMICPPLYTFKVVDHLVTNFHAPDSTLMLLVAAFINDAEGTKIPKIYEAAQENGYRFLSYGDVCMFSRPESL